MFQFFWFYPFWGLLGGGGLKLNFYFRMDGMGGKFGQLYGVTNDDDDLSVLYTVDDDAFEREDVWMREGNHNFSFLEQILLGSWSSCGF